MYSNEIKIKLESYTQNNINLKINHLEEIKNLRIEYENNLENMKKKFEDEKIELKNTIKNHEKEIILSNRKCDLNEKAEILEFQKKYMVEIRELQKSFEDFKIKTHEEIRVLKKQKEEEKKKVNLYQQNFECLKNESDQKDSIYRENIRNMKNKSDNFKIYIKNNEILKNQLNLSKSEISFLKSKINKLETSERKLQNLLLEKSMMNSNINYDYSQSNILSDPLYVSDNKSYFYQDLNNNELKNYDYNLYFRKSENPFSPPLGNNIIKRILYNKSSYSQNNRN